MLTLRFDRDQCCTFWLASQEPVSPAHCLKEAAAGAAGQNSTAELEGTMITTEREPHPSVTRIIDLFGDWLKQRRELNELMEYAADPGELEPDALQMLVRQGS